MSRENLSTVDRFIYALWTRNDQLSVYNPALKTQFDTYSWKKDIDTTDTVKVKEALRLYKEALLYTLAQDDLFALTFESTLDGRDFIRWAIGHDVRNMKKWISGKYGVQKDVKEKELTYATMMNALEIPDKLPLGSRDPDRLDGNGFKSADFVDVVREDFRMGQIRTDATIFGKSVADDHKHHSSNYLWFMYGILPRNDIKFLELQDGLLKDDANPLSVKHTIKFLGLLFNIRAAKVRFFTEYKGQESVFGLEYSFINPDNEMPKIFEAVELRTLDIDAKDYLSVKEKDKPKTDGKNGQGNATTERLKNEIKKMEDDLTTWKKGKDLNGKDKNAFEAKKAAIKRKRDEQAEEWRKINTEAAANGGSTTSGAQQNGGGSKKKVEREDRLTTPRREISPRRDEARRNASPVTVISPPARVDATVVRASVPRRRTEEASPAARVPVTRAPQATRTETPYVTEGFFPLDDINADEVVVDVEEESSGSVPPGAIRASIVAPSADESSVLVGSVAPSATAGTRSRGAASKASGLQTDIGTRVARGERRRTNLPALAPINRRGRVTGAVPTKQAGTAPVRD